MVIYYNVRLINVYKSAGERRIFWNTLQTADIISLRHSENISGLGIIS